MKVYNNVLDRKNLQAITINNHFHYCSRSSLIGLSRFTVFCYVAYSNALPSPTMKYLKEKIEILRK